MRQKPAILLLFLYFFLPTGIGYVRTLVAQTLLCQIKAIGITRQLEKRLASSMSPSEGASLLVFWLKWHRAMQSSLSTNAEKLDLWFMSLIYYLECGLYERAEACRDFLLASRVDPGNTTALAYLGLFTPCPVFLSHQNGDRIIGNGFTLGGQASPNVIILCKISSSLTVLGGLVPVADKESLLETAVQTDDSGRFQIQVPASSAKRSGTRYRVSVRTSGDLEMTTETQLTLIQE